MIACLLFFTSVTGEQEFSASEEFRLPDSLLQVGRTFWKTDFESIQHIFVCWAGADVEESKSCWASRYATSENGSWRSKKPQIVCQKLEKIDKKIDLTKQ